MQKLNTRQITTAALIGGIYVALSYFGNIFGLTYGPVQFRFSEALTVLPFLNPLATWGLFVGCILSNILSPYGLLDLIFGSLATLLAGLLTARCKHTAGRPAHRPVQVQVAGSPAAGDLQRHSGRRPHQLPGSRLYRRFPRNVPV